MVHLFCWCVKFLSENANKHHIKPFWKSIFRWKSSTPLHLIRRSVSTSEGTIPVRIVQQRPGRFAMMTTTTTKNAGAVHKIKINFYVWFLHTFKIWPISVVGDSYILPNELRFHTIYLLYGIVVCVDGSFGIVIGYCVSYGMHCWL